MQDCSDISLDYNAYTDRFKNKGIEKRGLLTDAEFREIAESVLHIRTAISA